MESAYFKPQPQPSPGVEVYRVGTRTILIIYLHIHAALLQRGILGLPLPMDFGNSTRDRGSVAVLGQ